ncbi:SDR family NAD(P)-dependent oxidoreductase [Yinghuangia sp. ASG 101]|uniref:SDR family NAD(P)-dependent oxidoreductase n=1 Tax=Yinghuangia sp. ASG 101 TaxID=2896848 RepID=UPI001E391F70|nr:SDR family NAD(P)-dependent oxidoreductase [Yinghuangia sp. ASG 101]UGQ15151.1 SDR family NAD(P)-dependent oxidoreductase [Yinghuangia sp. ASG 101]
MGGRKPSSRDAGTGDNRPREGSTRVGPTREAGARDRDPDQDLTGKTALVTGGSRGLGLLIARELADQGADVAICARDEDELTRAGRIIRRDTGREVASFVCDIGVPNQVDRLAEMVTDQLGTVDILVNNAGVVTVAPVEGVTPEQFESSMNVMFTGPMRLTLALLPAMRAQREGRIVNITSIGGRVVPPHLLPYACAKFAAVGFSEGLRAELRGTGVSVTTVVPGLMRTGSHRSARFGGRFEREYAWFSAAASMPLLSMNAERAARTIVRGAARRRPEIVLTPAAKAAVRLHGLAPATTVRLMALASRVLPEAAAGEDGGEVAGTAARSATPGWTNRVNTLGERAARRWNQPEAHDRDTPADHDIHLRSTN